MRSPVDAPVKPGRALLSQGHAPRKTLGLIDFAGVETYLVAIRAGAGRITSSALAVSYPYMTTFSDLGLSPDIVAAVEAAGYTTPTPIQEQAIPVALAGRDVLGIAQTGTGKTAAFTLPMIERLASGRAKARMPRSLVIAPTRELADQVAASFDKYAKGQKLTWALLIGGVSFADQEKKLDRGVDVLIATPGRLLDHFERGKLLMTGVQMLVVDEADRMLDMGFIPDIERIFKLTPAAKQTLFFSATMPPEITRLTKQFLKDPTRIEAARPATTAETIAQHVARIPSADPKAKRTALRALMSQGEVRNGIVFCNRKSEVDVVAKSLKTHGFDAAAIHGDLDQATRMRTLDAFRKGDLTFLVASDVAARGLDIPAVSHVFNYDVPHHADDYVHRIGRTGRAGRTGETFMIVTPADSRSYDKVLKLIGKTPEEMRLDIDWSQIGDSGGRGRPVRGDRSRGARAERSRDERRPPRAEREPEAEAAVAEAPPESVDVEAARRPRRRRRGEEPTTTVAAPLETAAEAPPAAMAEARPEPGPEPRRQARAERRPEPRAEARPQPREESRAEARRERGGQGRRGGGREPETTGFGADTPAFFLRVPRVDATAES
jgi:superfamily II DNA/RNA helicase